MSVLDKIVAQKRKDVAQRMAKTPFVTLSPEPTTRSLSKALQQPGLRFILECKKASPSEGLIRPNFDLTEIAHAYRPFADAISVLTDELYFQGNLDNIRRMRELLPQPILCKDFIVDPYQVVEARSYGADAVLLMLSVLDDDMYRRCAAAAQQLNMDVLTEVHDEDELARALALDAPIIGINNRDLKTLKVDLATTRRLAKKIPKDKIIVCESGIKTRTDIDAVSDVVDAYLVGSSLMKAPRLDLAVRTLLFDRVKICGLTTIADAQAAYDHGATFGGVIFAQESPRCITEQQALMIHQAVPLPLVGVFVNDDIERIAHLAHTCYFVAVQLHGEENEDFIRALKEKLLASCEIWKALRVHDHVPSLSSTVADRLLLDAFHPDQRGGSGQTFDWQLLADDTNKEHYILAGGITPDNVREARRIGCYAIDVNSGVEIAPGKKNEQAIQKLFSRLRGIA
jgi:Indole-3-glycerol phosphate synthase